MKVLVTGYRGQLGWEVVRLLEARGVPCRGVDQEDFDLTKPEDVLAYVRTYEPDVIVHCAAYTNVDFPGTGDTPYDIGDAYGPKNVYGVSKVQGEDAVRSLVKRFFILRTSWVFGKHGTNFVRTMLRLGAEKKELRVVSDQVGSPTYAVDLARVICDMIPTEKYGIYHVRNEGFLSWADFASMIMEKAGLPCRIIPVPTSEYPALARRPLNSRLNGSKLQESGFAPMPTVEDALDRFLAELNED